MTKPKQEAQAEAKNQAEFNSVTQKKKPENQNQQHNIKKQGADVDIRQI